MVSWALEQVLVPSTVRRPYIARRLTRKVTKEEYQSVFRMDYWAFLGLSLGPHRKHRYHQDDLSAICSVGLRIRARSCSDLHRSTKLVPQSWEGDLIDNVRDCTIMSRCTHSQWF